MQLLIVLAAPLFMTVAMANPNPYDAYTINNGKYAPSNTYNAYDTKGYDNKGYNQVYDTKTYDNGYNAKDTTATYGAKDAGNGYNSKDTPATYGAKDAGNGYYAPTADTRKHCIQEWFGTAPICKGECPQGWKTIRTSKKADKCEQSTDKKIVESCEMVSKNVCLSGIKTLCEKCY
ncbi:hypothetical protein TWF281_006952 [Arthrobotrys megalospora]